MDDKERFNPLGKLVVLDATSGKELFSVHMMLLAATKGTELEVIAVGEKSKEACAALKKLVESGFDEE